MSCEGDLTAADLDEATSAHTLSRVSGGSADSQNLFAFVAHHLSHGVNLDRPEALRDVLRPHHERDVVDPARSLSNLDEDDGVVVNVRFTEMVRVKAILLSAPPSGDERVARCRVWVNRPNGVDLADVDDVQVDQEFELLDAHHGAVEYPTRLSRFANVSSLSLHLVPRQSPGTLRLYYIGFKGASRSYQKEPGEHLVVAAQNAADAPVNTVREKFGAAQTTAR